MHEADVILRDIMSLQREMLADLKGIRGLLATIPQEGDGGAALRSPPAARSRPRAPREGSGMDIAARKG